MREGIGVRGGKKTGEAGRLEKKEFWVKKRRHSALKLPLFKTNQPGKKGGGAKGGVRKEFEG